MRADLQDYLKSRRSLSILYGSIVVHNMRLFPAPSAKLTALSLATAARRGHDTDSTASLILTSSATLYSSKSFANFSTTASHSSLVPTVILKQASQPTSFPRNLTTTLSSLAIFSYNLCAF